MNRGFDNSAVFAAGDGPLPGRAVAQPPQPPPMGYLLPDREPPPWNPEQDLYRRWRRRVRCEGGGTP